MERRMNVSVVIPTYNAAKTIGKCIESLLKSKTRPYEIIVVDDGSKDDSVNIIKRFPVRLVFQKNCGPSRARNHGASIAKSEVIAFIDSDCIAGKNWLKEISSFDSDKIGLIGGKNIDLSDGSVHPDDKEIPFHFRSMNIAIKKRVFNEIEGFDESFDRAAGEDIDFSVKVRERGYDLKYNEKAVVYHNHQRNFFNKCKQQYNYGYGDAHFLNKHFEYSKFMPYYPLASPLLAFLFAKKESKNIFSFLPKYLKQLVFFLPLRYLGKIKYSVDKKNIKLLLYQRKNPYANTKMLNEQEKNSNYFSPLGRFIERKLKREKMYLILYLSSKCNLRCEHCFYSKELNQNKKNEDLTLGDYKKLAKSFRNKIDRLLITGGEPFLRPDIYEITREFYKVGVKSFVFATNGVLTDKIVRFCNKVQLSREIKIKFQISLDGTKDIHNSIRKAKCFEKAIKTAQILKKRNIGIHFNTTISKSNITNIVSLVQYLEQERKLGISHFFSLVRGLPDSNIPKNICNQGYTPKSEEVMLSEDDLNLISKKLEMTFKNRAKTKTKNLLTLAGKKTMLDLFIEILKKKKAIVKCSAGRTRGVIYPNGDAALCEFMKPIGNLKDYNFDFFSIWHNDIANNYRKQIKNCYCTHGCFVNPEKSLKFIPGFLKNLYWLKKENERTEKI